MFLYLHELREFQASVAETETFLQGVRIVSQTVTRDIHRIGSFEAFEGW
jgi:hypothetical protein